jgi:hypothetical protein
VIWWSGVVVVGDDVVPDLPFSMRSATNQPPHTTDRAAAAPPAPQVMSGMLDWTPMHTSELFWRQNIDKFEEKDFQVLRVLLKLLEASREVRGAPRGVTWGLVTEGEGALLLSGSCSF